MPLMVYLIIILISTYRWNRKVIYVSSFIFYLISTPFFSNYFMKKTEGEYIYQNINIVEEADAIVILSGMMRINEFNNEYIIEWGDIDRFFKGIELFKSKKSKVIVFTGGKHPFNLTSTSEGDILKDYAIKFGLSPKDILVTNEVLNTSDESYAVLDLIGNKKKIILVTSAFHMKRASALFEMQGFKVIPYKVDFKTPPFLKPTFIDFIPSSNGLLQTEIAFREIIGRIYYKILYLLNPKNTFQQS